MSGDQNASVSNVKALADTSMCEQSTNPKAPQLTVRDLQEYRVYRIRLVQFLHIFLLYLDFKQGAEVPQNVMQDGPKEFAATLQVATLGWLASLVDRNSKAMNVFKLWVRLFPSRQPEIEAVRLAIQPHLKKLTEFRNVAAFHANRSFETQCSAYKAVTTPELSQATDKFFQLCISLLHEENSIPALKEERAKWAG